MKLSFETAAPGSQATEASIARHIRPKAILCENVKGLVAHNRGRTFKTIRDAFADIGYKVHHAILNSKDFGLAQSRERVYIICFRNDIDDAAFASPHTQPRAEPVKIADILEPAPIPSKYYLSDTYLQFCRQHRARHETKGNGFGYVIRDVNGIAGALVGGGMGRERNLIVDHRPHSRTPTSNIKGRVNDEDVRKLTPREWARLQGFPDSFKLPVSDSQLYKQLGNTVSVNVVEQIAKSIGRIIL